MSQVEEIPETSVLLVYSLIHAKPAFYNSMFQTVSALTRKRVTWEVLALPEHVPLTESRAQLFETFLQSKHTHIACLDSDLTFSGEDLSFLIESTEGLTALGAACPLPKFRWADLGESLNRADWTKLSAEEGNQHLRTSVASSLEYALVLPSKESHEVQKGRLVVDTLGFGCMVLTRDLVEKVVDYAKEEGNPSPYGSAETLPETAFCNAVRALGGRVEVHVGMNVVRITDMHFPGSLMEVFRRNGSVQEETAKEDKPESSTATTSA